MYEKKGTKFLHSFIISLCGNVFYSRWQQGEVAEGIDYINQVRRRADPSGTILPDRITTSQSEAMDFLILERRLELAGEQTRFFDLVRWGIAAQELSTFQEVIPILQGAINAITEINQGDQISGY